MKMENIPIHLGWILFLSKSPKIDIATLIKPHGYGTIKTSVRYSSTCLQSQDLGGWGIRSSRQPSLHRV